jgi:hypothetical protein
MDPQEDVKIDLTTKMKPAQGVASESLHTVRDMSPAEAEEANYRLCRLQ